MELPNLYPSGRKSNQKKLVEAQRNNMKQEDQFYKSSDKEILNKRLREIELENLSLKKRIWGLQYRGTIPASIALISTGGIMLLFSYLYDSLILTFMGLGLTSWGLLIFYVSPSRYVPEVLVNSIPLSMIKSIDELVVSMGYRGRTIFLHPKNLKGLAQGYVFIPYDDKCSLPSDALLTEEKVFYDEPKGIFMTAHSQGLVEVFEKELNVNFAMVNFEYIQLKLPPLLIEDLKLVDKISVEKNDALIEVMIFGQSCARLCDLVEKETRLGNHLGCPICSALGLVFSKVSGKPITIKESNVSNDKIKTIYQIVES